MGRWGETRAAQYLEAQGLYIVARNWHSRFGEIDLIVKNRKYICFVEVKMRNEHSIAQPLEFVDSAKQNKLTACAKLYLSSHKTDLQPRFDVVEVFCENNAIKSFKHLENAFELY